MSEEEKRKWAMWHIRVPDHLDSLLENYIEQDSFATKAEFVREAVRDRLETERKKLGTIPLKIETQEEKERVNV